MKGRLTVLDRLGDRPAAALLVDGRLEDLLIDAGTDLAPGAILRGKIDRVVQGGAFVALPGGQGYLRGARGLKAGQTRLVQVSGFAEPGKAVPVTDRLVFKGRTVIVTPGAEGINLSRQVRDEDERLRLFSAVDTYAAAISSHGIVVRTAATRARDEEIAEEIDAVLATADVVLAKARGKPEVLVPAPDAHALARREWLGAEDPVDTTGGAFDARGISDEIDALRNPEAALVGGGSIVVEATRALVAVDINTGADFSPAAGLKVNLEAARELPRQLRLRGLGGQIVVDFAPMQKQHRRALEEAVRKVLRADPVETTALGWTTLGHLELRRKRERRPVLAILDR